MCTCVSQTVLHGLVPIPQLTHLSQRACVWIATCRIFWPNPPILQMRKHCKSAEGKLIYRGRVVTVFGQAHEFPNDMLFILPRLGQPHTELGLSMPTSGWAKPVLPELSMGQTFCLLGDQGPTSGGTPMVAGGAAGVGNMRSSQGQQLGLWAQVLISEWPDRWTRTNTCFVRLYFLLGGSGRIDVGDEVKGTAKTIRSPLKETKASRQHPKLQPRFRKLKYLTWLDLGPF